MKFNSFRLLLTGLFSFCLALDGFAQSVKIEATNPLSIGRLNQTLSVKAKDLSTLNSKGVDLKKVWIKDDAGRTLLVQAVDSDGDEKPDEVIFQADFGPNQKRVFYIYEGTAPLYQPDQFKAYGRFVRERLDDFAWENDRIAQRTYGPALITAKVGPLTSSAIDIWPKSTDKLIINDWYMTDHYHVNTGDGADLYRSGQSLGVGGEGLWLNNQLWKSENFAQSSTLANGPIRVSFDLTFHKFEVGKEQAGKVKHISLDAGQNLNHYRVEYPSGNGNNVKEAALGIQITNESVDEIRKGLKLPVNNGVFIENFPGKLTAEDSSATRGWITLEQPVSEGVLYTAIVFDPEDFVKFTRDAHDKLVVVKLKDDKLSYWAGYAWSESGQFNSYQEWKDYIKNFALGLQSPVNTNVLK